MFSIRKSLLIMIVGWLITYLSWTLCLAFDANGFVFFVLSVLLFGVGLPMFAFGALILIFQSLKTLTIDSRALSSQDMRELLKEGKLILYPELLTNSLDYLLVGFGVCPFVIHFVLDGKMNLNFLCFIIFILVILVIRLIPGSCSLTIEKDSFTVQNYFLPSEYRFDEIEYFEFFYVIGKRRSFELLGFGCKKSNWLMRIFWDGRDGFLPAETYSGISSYKLFELMEEVPTSASK